jgi:hypothetical protein
MQYGYGLGASGSGRVNWGAMLLCDPPLHSLLIPSAYCFIVFSDIHQGSWAGAETEISNCIQKPTHLLYKVCEV